MDKEKLTIIGTAHVSQESVEEVKDAIYSQNPDVVAIELDFGRYKRLMEEKQGIAKDEEIKVSKIIKDGKVGVFITTSILSYFQNKIGEDLDVKPGSEMIAAIDAAKDVDARIALIDRDINITFERALNQMSVWEKLKFIFSSIFALFAGDDEIENIEELKNSAKIDEIMEQFKDISPTVYEVLVKERDAYLANSILNIPEEHVIAVVGAGHKPGINKYLNNPETLPSMEKLTDIGKKGIPWLKIILLLIPISFVVIFFLAFINGINITNNLIEFVLISGICGFIGSILSGSKIQSAIVAFIVAPFTIIHPLLAAGWFSGLSEVKFRKVRQSDIRNISNIKTLKDLWNNNIFRILLVVIGTNLGVSVATLVILPSRIFFPLATKMFGG
ncbi:MAG: TraB/GumN family protein [Methanobrevibacter sp.]|jgi:pheromone shutdown-related protein TraB|nr:TraB/GumN family protein [Candidatus Methanoflexus mossambicus]